MTCGRHSDKDDSSSSSTLTSTVTIIITTTTTVSKKIHHTIITVSLSASPPPPHHPLINWPLISVSQSQSQLARASIESWESQQQQCSSSAHCCKSVRVCIIIFASASPSSSDGIARRVSSPTVSTCRSSAVYRPLYLAGCRYASSRSEYVALALALQASTIVSTIVSKLAC